MSTETQQAVELFHPDPTGDLVVSRPPKMVIAEAREAATALNEILSSKKKKIMFNDEQYLELDDWQLLGQFYGLAAKVVSTSLIQIGNVVGYEAAAELIRIDTGTVIGRAEAMCLNDEEKWSTRPKYEWKDILDANGQKQWYTEGGKRKCKSERVKVGEVSVPLFQLRSMAQTRACAKAYRNKLSWVAVLAGYRPTPAEEMEDHSGYREPAPPRRSQASVPEPLIPADAVPEDQDEAFENLSTEPPARTETVPGNRAERAAEAPVNQETGPSCPKCGGPMRFKPYGVYGPFWSCRAYSRTGCKGSVNEKKWREMKGSPSEDPLNFGN